MSFEQLLKRQGISIEANIPDDWPVVDEASVPERHRDRFQILLGAGLNYVETSESSAVVAKRHRISERELCRRVLKSMETHPDGLLIGERAFVPYARHTLVVSVTKQSGPMTKLMGQFPELCAELVKDYVNGIRFKNIYSKFISRLEKSGVQEHDYPFKHQDRGHNALRRFLKKQDNQNFRAVSRGRGGRAAGRRADHTGPGVGKDYSRPYQRVELDTHTVDAVFQMEIRDVDGEMKSVPMARVLVIVIIDCYSRAILGYNLCLRLKENTQDVMEAIACSLAPGKKDRGLPLDLSDVYRYRAFDELGLDNSYVQISTRFQDILGESIQGRINTGRAATPEGRGIVESFFKYLTENGYQRLPSTTGGNARSPKRRDPDKKAVRFHISIEDAEAILEKLVYDYNYRNHPSTRQAPVERLREYHATKNALIRKLSPRVRDLKFLFRRVVNCTVRGGTRTGSRCYVQFESAQYSNDLLASTGSLSNTEIKLIFDDRDLRTAEAFLPNGKSLGVLTARANWGQVKHSYRTRKALNKLNYQRKLQDLRPITLDEQFERIEREAITHRKARNEQMRLQREREEPKDKRPPQKVSRSAGSLARPGATLKPKVS